MLHFVADGDAAANEEDAATAQEIASKQTKGTRLAAVGRGARKSMIHDTKHAMRDDVYTQAGAE